MRFFQNVFFMMVMGVVFSANAEAPHVFTYNGRLEKDGVLVTGEVQMRVSLSSSVDLVEEPFWSQEYPVSVQNGAFSIQVGERVPGQPENPLDVDPFAGSGEVFIGVEVGEEAGGAAEGGQGGQEGAVNWVFIGRKKLTASPYAITADYASRSKGMTIESDTSISDIHEDAPLKITDGNGSTLKIDGNGIDTTSRSLGINSDLRVTGALTSRAANLIHSRVLTQEDINLVEEVSISSAEGSVGLGSSEGGFDRFCFLSLVDHWGDSGGFCNVSRDINDGSYSWTLSAQSAEGGLVSCSAYCVRFR